PGPPTLVPERYEHHRYRALTSGTGRSGSKDHHDRGPDERRRARERERYRGPGDAPGPFPFGAPTGWNTQSAQKNTFRE
ncbi:MAG: hypothetical protein ACLP7F_20025, partial [Acidimicrobiales bacterium]